MRRPLPDSPVRTYRKEMVKVMRQGGTQASHKCPVCRQPVTATIKKHKSLGVFVPVWVPDPCGNPRCSAHVSEPQSQKPEDRHQEAD